MSLTMIEELLIEAIRFIPFDRQSYGSNKKMDKED
mgnify:CR=1 FL=1